jgi:hypothetical protein
MAIVKKKASACQDAAALMPSCIAQEREKRQPMGEWSVR